MRLAATLVAHDDHGVNNVATSSCGDVLVVGRIPSVPWEGGAAHESDECEGVGKMRTLEREVAPERLQAARRSKMAKSERAVGVCEWERAYVCLSL